MADVLEPLERGLGGALGGLDHRAALGLVRRRARQSTSGVLVQAGGQREGVLHGQLGAGADREVRGVRGVAEQHHVAVCQRSLRTVVKFSHLELLVSTRWPASSSAKISRDPRDRLLVADARAGSSVVRSRRSRPARQTSSCISTMNVEPASE